MALLPNHSPPFGPQSPPQSLNGYQYPVYGPHPRPMPPPSPFPPQPYKRPGSSMSISSMLGSEQDHYKAPPRPHSTIGPSMSVGAVMSPPQYPPYYKTRSPEPNRCRSGSGSMIQRPGAFDDEAAERARRTSLSGILQEKPTGTYDTRPPALPRPRESHSPEMRREPRGLMGLLNGADMQRQDSQDRKRPFSPFSVTPSVTSQPADERKGSDELSQHRALLALAADSKRGRYSPVPQAVQGAQARTPVPDAGIKSEQGRVFAGLGGGLANPTSNPIKDRLSEENLMKMSRSTSGIKRRKYDEDPRAESEGGDRKTARKRSKYAPAYKVDLEKERTNGVAHTRSEPFFKPRKTIRISSIVKEAEKHSRRHLGNFTYDPEISKCDVPSPGFDKFDASIKPNLLPSFTHADQVNCTYSVRVPKIWLQDRERSLLCKSACLWGSGIYTDDSDPVTAAMHAGYIQSKDPDNVDAVLLDRVVKDQNARIEGLINAPKTPSEPAPGKDAIITLIVLPALDNYTGSSRFGITSRSWPGLNSRTTHDGVSFAFLKIEFVDGGIEGRRMGRTGLQKRKRMIRELQERRMAETLMKEMSKKAKQKFKPQMTGQKKPHPLSDVENASDTRMLNIGQTPDEWLKKLTTTV